MIAVDAMGGDNAPQAVVLGALGAAKKEVPISLFGQQDVIKALLDEADASWRSLPLHIIHSDQVVEMGEDPVSAVRNKKDSSLVQAVASVKAGQAHAAISAGNSGAVMAAGTFLLGRKQGVERPAIAGWIPAYNGPVLALDLGANADCKPHYLVQFAHMGSEHVTLVKNIKQPRVALLSNGEEPGKGNALGKEVFSLLENETGINFIGNIEPHHIVENKADVVVSDGFAGNVLLKAMEATAWLAKQLFAAATKEFLTATPTLTPDQCKVAQQLAQKVESYISHKTDSSEQGGAFLLGVNGHVLVAHGSAQADAIENAITMVWQHVRTS